MPESSLVPAVFAFTVSEDELLKFVAILLLILAAARVLWPEFAALVRQVWKDVVAASRAVRSIRREPSGNDGASDD